MKKGSIIAIIIGGVVLLGVLVVIVIAVGLYWFARESPAPRIVYNDPPTLAMPSVPEQAGEIVIDVHADGSVSGWGKSLADEEFAVRLAAIADENPDHPVRLRADAATPFQCVVDVIDTCREAGIWNISFATQSPESAE